MFYVTSILRKDKELRKVILENIDFSPFSFSDETMSYSKNVNSKIMGSAYEIVIQLMNMKDPYDLYKMKFNRGIYHIKTAHKYSGGKQKKKLKKWIKRYKRSFLVLEKFLKGKKVGNKQLAKAIMFLNFVSIFRNVDQVRKTKYKRLKKEEKEIIILLDGVSRTSRKKLKKAKYNVVLGHGKLSGEIDIFLKNSIYDIKTTSYPKFTNDMIIQLVLYYYLAKKNGIKVRDLGIFFSKFNHFEIVKVKSLFKNGGEKRIFSYLSRKY